VRPVYGLNSIVAIHGLDGHREASWTANNDKLWLRDFLPQHVPSTRILTYGYDAYTVTSSTQTLNSHAENFLARLAAFRMCSDTPKRPIIFIAHNLGGIILKHALIKASHSHKGHMANHKAIAVSTYGILFLGTPHQGTTMMTNPADQLLKLESLSTRTNNILLKHLASNSEWLQQLLSDYNAINAKFCTKCFYEILPTVFPDQSSQIIVPKSSAVILGAVDVEVVGMNKDRNGMTKFRSQSDDDFIFMSFAIQNMIKNALSVVEQQWIEFECNAVSTGVKYKAKRRPSPRFLGQELYLTVLRKFFALDNTQPWRHFLLYGMAGVGKTQICLKFIEEALENDYNYWKIIWVDATDTVTLEDSLASIADDPDVKPTGIERSSAAVLEWLAHSRRKWLLVFDNTDGMNDKVPHYLQQIRMIHVLITSRSTVLSTYVTSYINVQPMDDDNAVSLFQRAARLPKCSDTTITILSKDITRSLGCLPLAVDIAGAAVSTGL